MEIQDLKDRVNSLDRIVSFLLFNALSKTAKENYFAGPISATAFEGLAREIIGWTREAWAGRSFNDDRENFPSPGGDMEEAKKYIAEIYMIEPSDIDLLNSIYGGL